MINTSDGEAAVKLRWKELRQFESGCGVPEAEAEARGEDDFKTSGEETLQAWVWALLGPAWGCTALMRGIRN